MVFGVDDLALVGVAGVGGTLLGGLFGKGAGGASELSGSGLFEVGTSKKLIKTQDSYSYQSSYQFSPTTSNQFTYSPSENFAPTNDFSPITNIGSPNSIFSTKKESSLDFTNKPTVTGTVAPDNSLTPSQSTAQGMGTGTGSLLDGMQNYLLIGGIGFLVYTYIKRGKKK